MQQGFERLEQQVGAVVVGEADAAEVALEREQVVAGVFAPEHVGDQRQAGFGRGFEVVGREQVFEGRFEDGAGFKLLEFQLEGQAARTGQRRRELSRGG
ncbi:hypothetical protein D9M69_645610 [compost metagenome]